MPIGHLCIKNCRELQFRIKDPGIIQQQLVKTNSWKFYLQLQFRMRKPGFYTNGIRDNKYYTSRNILT